MAERAVSKIALRISKREERRLERAVVREGMVLRARGIAVGRIVVYSALCSIV